jgi:hypothetical protein
MGEVSLVGGVLFLLGVLVVGVIFLHKKGGVANKPKGEPAPGTFPDPDPKEDKN